MKRPRTSYPPPGLPSPVRNPALRTATILPYPWALIIWLFLAPLNAQKARIDVLGKDLADLKTTSYAALDSLLRPYQKDTLVLNALTDFLPPHQYPAVHSFLICQKATLYHHLGFHAKAARLLHLALPLAEQADHLELLAHIHTMMGKTAAQGNVLKKALDHYKKGLKLIDSLPQGSPGIRKDFVLALHGVGSLYQSLGQYDLAILEFEKVLEHEKGLDNAAGMALALQYIGNCLVEKGLWKKALSQYHKGLRLANETDQGALQITLKNAMAQVYLQQQDLPKATALTTELENSLYTITDTTLLGGVLINIGWAKMQLDSLERAEKELIKGLAFVSAAKNTTLIYKAYRIRSLLEARKGNYKKALEYRNRSGADAMDPNKMHRIRFIADQLLERESDKRLREVSNLANESELTKLRVRRNRTTILLSALVIGLVGTILFIMYRQYQSNYERRVMSLEQNMLRSQMNPHFLFNSLNSIKLYIINNDKKNAVRYLNKFSKLVRRILDGSSVKETTLADELETAELYLHIENIRFSDGILYAIKVSEDIDPERIKIPSLVLQPFLENAIWHGLSAKEGPRKLWLHVSQKDPFHVNITIMDNGVGRQVSEKIKRQRIVQRKSVGITNTMERLANFARDFQYDSKVEIIDLFDVGGKPVGTKIILEIPTT